MNDNPGNRKRALVCISHYGNANDAHLATLLEEYRRMRNYEIHLLLDVTEPVRFDIGLPGVVRQYSPAIRQGLTFTHRAYVEQHVSDYDLFIYSEDDLLITEENIHAYLALAARLPPPWVAGFLRYETLPGSGARYLVDAHPHWPVLERVHWFPGNELFFSLVNKHQACWILTRDQVASAIAGGGFMVAPHGKPYGVLEQGASDVYTQCGRRKILSMGSIFSLCVHHLPNKYARMWASSSLGQTLRLDELLSHVLKACGESMPRVARPVCEAGGSCKLY